MDLEELVEQDSDHHLLGGLESDRESIEQTGIERKNEKRAIYKLGDFQSRILDIIVDYRLVQAIYHLILS